MIFVHYYVHNGIHINDIKEREREKKKRREEKKFNYYNIFLSSI